ncbi:MAG: flavin reductase, partial [Promethearchaeota archaeon]
YNMMTIGWGLLGTLWGKPVAMVYVRPSRYTYEFMEINNTFSITAFSKDFRKILNLCGSKSGREINKMKIDGLTPKEVEKTVFFTEAELVLICKKTYFNDLVPDHIPEESKLTYYNSGDYHRVYYGEILNCYKND